MVKNDYLVRGVADDAKRENIKAAFRPRPLELHPDRRGRENGPVVQAQVHVS